MTERWRSALDELSRVPMTEGLRERAEEGPRLPEPGAPSGVHRAAIVALALAVFALGAFGAWVALRPASAPARPASGAMSQRVFGVTLCYYRSSPDEKLSATS